MNFCRFYLEIFIGSGGIRNYKMNNPLKRCGYSEGYGITLQLNLDG